MNPERLLTHFDRIAEAPDAVPRVRRFVLDLAVRGKLVEQDPNDESPFELLKQAQRRLEKAAKTTKRMRWKPSATITLGDGKKDVPSGWLPARVNDTGLYINGLAFKPSDWKQEGLPIIRIQNLTDPSKEFNFAQGDFPDEVLVRDGDVLVSWSATLDAFKWDRSLGVLNQHIFRVIPDESLTTRDFLLLLLRHAIREMADSVHAHGLVMTHINRGPFLAHIVLIPPLAEQHRIVAKVDELTALCDRLETAQNKREQRRDRLVAASLNRMNQPALSAEGETATAFREHACFHLEHLPRLTTRPEHIKLLRKTILNLAVRGKVVEQDPADEPAFDLLMRTAEAKGRSRRTIVTIGSEAEPYRLPSTWQWASLDQVIVAGPQNGISPKPTTREDAPKAITLTATTSGVFNPAHFKRVEAKIPDESGFWLSEGDLLFQRGNTREYVGIAAIYDGPPKSFLFPDLMIKVRVSNFVNLRFIHLAAVSPPARTFLSESASGAQATMPKINQTTLVSLPIPLPPLAEQHRIVAKVDELMAVCDQLEAQLTTTQTDSRRLLEAVLHEALAPAMEEAA